MPLKIGSSAVDAVKLGASNVDAIYLGAANIGAGGGGGGYVAKAVHFDGSAYIDNVALVCVDSSDVSGAFSFKISATDPRGILVSDPTGNANNIITAYSHDGEYYLDIFLGKADFSSFIEFGIDLIINDDHWHTAVWSADLNHAAGARRVKFYVDDVDVAVLIEADTGSAFAAEFSGLPTRYAYDGNANWLGDFADFRLLIGTSLLDGGGDIPLATRRLFIDGSGKPVDPATATAELGLATILFSGDASAFGTNQGPGGAFSLTGSLTNASTSPSD